MAGHLQQGRQAELMACAIVGGNRSCGEANRKQTIAGQEYEGFYFKPVALSLNGERIAAGSLDGIDGKITIYDITSPEEVEVELLAEKEG